MRLGFTNHVSSKERLSSTKRQKQDIKKKSYRQKKGVSVLLKRTAEISEDSLVAICILFVSRDLLPPYSETCQFHTSSSCIKEGQSLEGIRVAGPSGQEQNTRGLIPLQNRKDEWAFLL